jgi:hypothetical protein
MSLLTDKQKEELQKLADEVLKESELVVKDYQENPSELSGSKINVHINSPILKEDDK